MQPDDRYIDTLRALPGLRVAVEETPIGAGAIVRLSSEAGTTQYIVESKSNLTTTTLGPILSQLEHSREALGYKPLLAAPYITPRTAEKLLQQGIEFVDGAGNVHLDDRAAYVLVLGKKPGKVVRSSGLSSTDLRLVFALLVRPQLRVATYRTLSALTGISLGKISATITKLADSNYVTRAPSGKLLLREPRALLERWDVGYLEQLRPTLGVTTWRLTSRRTVKEIANEVMETYDVLIGGEHAAGLLAGHLKPMSIALHVPKGKAKLVAAQLQLVPTDGSSEVVMLERFAPEIDTASATILKNKSLFPLAKMAHPILVRSELLRDHDARLRDAAEVLFRDVIQSGLDNASA